jgi:hypothetical protein
MSYDLFFYKRKGTEVSTGEISEYLSDNLVPANEGNTQWFFENEDTEVYFSFDRNEPDEIFEADEETAPIENFDDTNFTFNLNFMRPSFFGLEAFKFVEQFCCDLHLFVLNPQSDSEQPYKPNRQEQFDIWNKTNLRASKDHFKETQSCFLSEETCIKVWEYNSNRQDLQQKLGEAYFVPKIFFFNTKQTREPFTLAVWPEHIPVVLPATDYILLTRQYRKFFRTVKDTALVSATTLLNVAGNYFDNFEFPNCKIIHPDKANRIKDTFNAIKAEKELDEFAERLGMENLYNAKPD